MTRAQAAQLQGNSKLAPQKDGIVVLRDFTDVFKAKGHGGDLRAFWMSGLEKEVLPNWLRVLTVENHDSFALVESGKNGLPPFDLAVLLSGKPSLRLAKWLGGLTAGLVVHYGDFDYEGLRIYQMLRSQMTEATCRLHRPEGLEEAFARQRALGKGTMHNQQRRPDADSPEVIEILKLIDRYGGVGVEQQVFDPVVAEVD